MVEGFGDVTGGDVDAETETAVDLDGLDRFSDKIFGEMREIFDLHIVADALADELLTVFDVGTVVVSTVDGGKGSCPYPPKVSVKHGEEGCQQVMSHHGGGQ